MTRALFSVLVLGLGLGAAGCGKDAATPTSASSTGAVSATTRLFTGTLAQKDTQYYSFTVPQDSGVFLTLASVTTVNGREADTSGLGLGLGVPRGTGCQLSTRGVMVPGLAAQLREWTSAGVHCVAVYDPGTLTGPRAFAVRIGYYQ